MTYTTFSMNARDNWRNVWEIAEADEMSDTPPSAFDHRCGLSFIYVYADVGPDGAFEWFMVPAETTREREQQLSAETGESYGAFHAQLYEQGLQLWHELAHEGDGSQASPGLLH